MTVTYVGGIPLGDALPGVQAPIIAAMGDIQGRLNALLAFQPTAVPPSIAADIQVCNQILVNLSLALEPPSIALQAQIMLDVIALLQAQLQVFVHLFDLFAFGAHVYAYQGQTNQLGTEFSTELSAGVPGGAGTDIAYALLFITTVPAVWGAMAEIFKTTP